MIDLAALRPMKVPLTAWDFAKFWTLRQAALDAEVQEAEFWPGTGKWWIPVTPPHSPRHGYIAIGVKPEEEG